MYEAVVDTNILVRVITNDNQQLATKAVALLGQYKAGQILLETSVFYETIFILTSKNFYHMPRKIAADALRDILATGLFASDEELLLAVLDLYQHAKLDFVDCLVVASVHLGRAKTVLSQDKALLAQIKL